MFDLKPKRETFSELVDLLCHLFRENADLTAERDAWRETARAADAAARRAAKRERAARGRRRESAQTREVGA